MTTLVVMAKECVPGRVKTRLHPPFTLEDAARIAAASLRDTLDTGRAAGFGRLVLCFEGEPPDAPGWEVVPQAAGGLDERLGAILDASDGPTIVIGMDTPQWRTADLPAGEWPDGVDALLGPASDGGFWALGLREPHGDVVRGVPMSRPDTGARQRDSLASRGLRITDLLTLTDLDDARSLAVIAPQLRDGHLARVLDDLGWAR